MKYQHYPSDLTDAQWALLEPLLPPPKPGGRPRQTNMRALVHAPFYLNREGCRWRAVPHDFGIPWKTAYNYFEAWKRDGTWDRLLNTLRPRVRHRRVETPTPALAASIANRSKRPWAVRKSTPTAARRSAAANAIFSWIPWVCCWPWS